MCTLEKHGGLCILTLTGDGEHRLNPSLIDAIRDALRRVRSQTPLPSALITTAHGKFFSNGFDLAWARSSPDPSARLRLMDSKLRAAVADLLSLPVPTIAAVTGHASAAGLLLALAHDHVLMRRDRGFLYMSEVDIGLVIPHWFMAQLRSKIGSPAARVDAVLLAEKVTAEAALRKGMIRSAHAGVEETLAAAVALGEELAAKGWNGHVYGQNREALFSEVLDAIRAADAADEAEQRRKTPQSRL